MGALFKTIEEVAAVVPVMKSFDFALILPDLERAENRFIIDIVGQAQYDNIYTPYQAGTSLTTAQTNLLNKMRTPVAHLAYYLYSAKGNVEVGSSGIHQMHSETSKPAFQWAVDEMRKAYIDGGYDGLEALAEYLEANKATYTIWAASAAYTKSKELFVNTTREFNDEFASLNNSRRLFMAMRHILKRHDNKTIKAVLGTTLFTEIKSQITAGTVTSLNETLLTYIRPALVNLTVMDAIPELGLKIDEFGITVSAPTTSSTTQNQSARTVANADQVNSLWKNVKKVGEDYLAGLKDYLQTNAADYPLYTATEDFSKTYANDQDSGVVFL